MMHKGQSTQWTLRITKDQMFFVREGYDVWSTCNCKKVKKKFLQTNNSNVVANILLSIYLIFNTS